MEKYDTLVLSGNSTNAIATLGSVQHLYDKMLLTNINRFVGTSSGSLISVLLAVGYQPIEILSYLCVNKAYSKISGFSLSGLIIQGSSLLKFEPIEEMVCNMIVEKIGFVPTLSELKEIFGKTLICVAYNITAARKEYISAENYPNLLVSKATRMSSTFPFVFEPFEFESNYFVDGGVTDNFAMNFAQIGGFHCIGIYNTNPAKSLNHDAGFFELLKHLFMVFICSMAATAKAEPGSKILKLEFEYSFFNFSSSNKSLINLFDIGYDECKLKHS